MDSAKFLRDSIFNLQTLQRNAYLAGRKSIKEEVARDVADFLNGKYTQQELANKLSEPEYDATRTKED